MTQRPQWQGLDPWTRKALLTGLIMGLLIFLLPFLFLSGEGEPRPAPPPLPTATLPVLEGEPKPVSGWDGSQTLRFLGSGGEVEVMTLRDYLWGVVAAEMPAAFQPEALKAQAVAARTYCFHLRQAPGDKHPDADVCGDYTCCQAYLTRAQAEENWGEDASRYVDKITQALDETDGLLCLYGGTPIDALFFSSAAGNTLDAVEVWGSEVPYLRSVTSPEGEEVPGWQTVVSFTPAEFSARFSESYPQAEFSGKPETWISVPALGPSGTVARMDIGGVEVTGAQVRQALGLRSAHFSVEAGEEEITFQVTGYGHGVGMSQYGANAMAKEGKTFAQILTWYYTDVTVGPLPE